MPLLFHMATIQQKDKTRSEKTSFPTANKPVSCEFTAKNKHFSSATGFLAILFAVNYAALIGRMLFVTVPVSLGALAAAPPSLY